MKRTTLLFVTLALTLVFVAPQHAFGNGRASGSRLELALEGFPDMVSPGSSMEGTITIHASRSGSAPRFLTFEVFFDTPLGLAVLNDGRMRIRPGAIKVLKVDREIGEHAAPGSYRLVVVAYDGDERLLVEHEFVIEER